MRINNNMMAMNSHRQLGLNNNSVAKATEKLASGFRINRAGDDAAGLSISEKMRGQIRGLNMASRNAQDSISLIQTAEGALNESHAILQRMRELAVQSANDTNVSIDRTALQNEMDQLATELTRIANNTEFNTQKLLSGGLATTALTFHIGANSGQNISLNIKSMTAESLGVQGENAVAGQVSGTGINISTRTAADMAITKIESGIRQVSAERSKLGAIQNRLEHTIKNLDNVSENLQASESRIRDVDMAKEMMEFTKQNILSQAATSMLAQANMAPQNVLQLLG
ncbi:flagellin [Anoxynatronum sibiricum]|uniref:Flagellin n=1 Tax=Anoxynatronum sibiricum TaxID=210623 RepID=A0ABU9VUF5_9CLOT